MTFRPLRDLVLIRPKPQDEITVGGLIIPGTAQERSQEGVIVEVGPGARNKKGAIEPVVVEPGTRVLFGKAVGMKIKIDGEEYLIMAESEIIGIVR